MPTIKFSTVFQLVLTALVLGACFSSIIQGKLGAINIDAASPSITPTVFAGNLARSGLNSLNNFANPVVDDGQSSSKIQVQVQVQATGNAKAEGSAKGPGDTTVSANTNGPGNALASALSNLPQEGKTAGASPATGQAPGQLSPTVIPSAQTFPQAIINEASVNLRRGPGTFYDVAGIATRGQTFEMVARTEDYHWWQVCCFNNERVWMSDQVVYVYGAINTLEVVPNPVLPAQAPVVPTDVPTLPPPTLAPTLVPLTPIPAAFDFDLIAHEQFEESITPRIYLYVYAGAEGLGGYTLRVKKDGVELPVSGASFGGQPGMTWPLPIPRQRFYNMKLEYKDTPSAGFWEIQLVDLAGKVVGPPATFNLSGNEQDQEMYVRYQKR